MRYIKEINGKLEEYNGLGVSSRFLIEQGYIKTNLSEPLNVLKIENNKIVLKTEDELLNDLNANDKLWNSGKTFYSTKCFYNCTSLTNYAEIPDDWK